MKQQALNDRNVEGRKKTVAVSNGLTTTTLIVLWIFHKKIFIKKCKISKDDVNFFAIMRNGQTKITIIFEIC
jgi:hypothetical protein